MDALSWCEKNGNLKVGNQAARIVLDHSVMPASVGLVKRIVLCAASAAQSSTNIDVFCQVFDRWSFGRRIDGLATRHDALVLIVAEEG